MLCLLIVIIDVLVTCDNLNNVVFAGDSITVGYGLVNSKRRYSTSVVELLKLNGYPNATEINLGQTGMSLTTKMAHLSDYPSNLLRYQPDLIVMQWGVNDHFYGASVSQYLTAYEKVLSYVREARPLLPIIVVTLCPDFRYSSNKHIKQPNFLREVTELGLHPIWEARANAGLQLLALKYNCSVAYVHESLDHSRKGLGQGIHPQKGGHKVIALTVYEAIKKGPISTARPTFSTDSYVPISFLGYKIFPLDRSPDKWVVIKDLALLNFTLHATRPFVLYTPGYYIAESDYQIIIMSDNDERRVLSQYSGKVFKNSSIYISFDPTTLTSDVSINIKASLLVHNHTFELSTINVTNDYLVNGVDPNDGVELDDPFVNDSNGFAEMDNLWIMLTIVSIITGATVLFLLRRYGIIRRILLNMLKWC